MKRRSAIVLLLTLVGLAPTSSSAQEKELFALSMFHFNVQYVAGGLEGFPDGVSNQPGFQLDERTVEDLIVTESFAPLLDLLSAHPTWTLTVELQGYMIEIMLERHREVAEHLRELVDAGQIELVSFHWSDQLFLAYPRVAMERSHEMLDEVVAEAGLTLSPVTFCQEGQFGEGMARLAPEHGQTILGLPKNLFRFQHASAEATAAPLYRLEDTDVILIGRGYDSPERQVVWTFFDDGELWSTNDANPYFGPDFRLQPESVARYEQEVADLEAAGFRISSIEDYVESVKASGPEAPALPPVLDGTWQPASTESMYRWMGRIGLWDGVYKCERDNEVVSGNARTIHELVTAEVLLEWARSEGIAAEGDVRPCWRDALLGQVTDASGINPFIGEVQYGLEHAAAARACAAAITEGVAARAGHPFLVVDHETRTVTPQSARPSDGATPAEPRLDEADGFVVDALGREVELLWEAAGDGVHRVTITARADATGDRSIEVTFPFLLDELRLSPGLVEDEVRTYPLDAFELEEGTISIPVANGLFGLDESLWVIKDTSTVHVAATIRAGEPTLTFRDDTTDPLADATWRFLLVDGTAEEALAVATRTNVRPTAVVAGPTRLAVEGGGCSCRTGAGGGASSLALLGALSLLLRRRRQPV